MCSCLNQRYRLCSVCLTQIRRGSDCVRRKTNNILHVATCSCVVWCVVMRIITQHIVHTIRVRHIDCLDLACGHATPMCVYVEIWWWRNMQAVWLLCEHCAYVWLCRVSGTPILLVISVYIMWWMYRIPYILVRFVVFHVSFFINFMCWFSVILILSYF